MGVPPGGPVDKTPPRLVSYQPDSLLVSAPAKMPLRFTFSEKLERRGFASSLRIVPPVAVGDPKFDGKTVEVKPTEDWPDDDVVFWTLLPTLKDHHGVPLGMSRSGAFTRRDSLPEGAVRWTPTLKDPASLREGQVIQGLLEIPPEPEERRGRLWRSTASTSLAPMEAGLLDVPSGPFNLTVFVDANGNARRDEREPVAEVDSLFLRGPNPILDVGTLELIDLEAPVALRICSPASDDSILVEIFVEGLDGDVAPQRQSADSTGCAAEFSLVPGLYRIGAWRDEQVDRLFGPDSLGTSEPFLSPIEIELRPATPDSVNLDAVFESLSWDVVDTMRTPPVPSALQVGPTR